MLNEKHILSYILTSEWFPGLWILCADVSEHKIQTTRDYPKEIYNIRNMATF